MYVYAYIKAYTDMLVSYLSGYPNAIHHLNYLK